MSINKNKFNAKKELNVMKKFEKKMKVDVLALTCTLMMVSTAYSSGGRDYLDNQEIPNTNGRVLTNVKYRLESVDATGKKGLLSCYTAPSDRGAYDLYKPSLMTGNYYNQHKYYRTSAWTLIPAGSGYRLESVDATGKKGLLSCHTAPSDRGAYDLYKPSLVTGNYYDQHKGCSASAWTLIPVQYEIFSTIANVEYGGSTMQLCNPVMESQDLTIVHNNSDVSIVRQTQVIRIISQKNEWRYEKSDSQRALWNSSTTEGNSAGFSVSAGYQPPSLIGGPCINVTNHHEHHVERQDGRGGEDLRVTSTSNSYAENIERTELEALTFNIPERSSVKIMVNKKRQKANQLFTVTARFQARDKETGQWFNGAGVRHLLKHAFGTSVADTVVHADGVHTRVSGEFGVTVNYTDIVIETIQ